MFSFSFGLGHYIPREDKLSARVNANLLLAEHFERQADFERSERYMRKALSADDKLQRLRLRCA